MSTSVDAGRPDSEGGSKMQDSTDGLESLERAPSYVHSQRDVTASLEKITLEVDGESSSSKATQHIEVQVDGPDLPQQPSTLLDEISRTQEKLRILQEQAARKWEHTSSDGTLKDALAHNSDNIPVDDDKQNVELRKHVRRAASSRKSREKVEMQAEATSEQRAKHGIVDRDDFLRPTMYSVNRDGSMFDGHVTHAILDPGRWRDERQDQYNYGEDITLRRNDHAQGRPDRGVRPPTALRPSTRQHEISDTKVVRLSRKLGPPTEWDLSDSAEWSSDGSSRSRDFNYFRARLRGDFEWELDRLNAQVERYKKFKEKKARKLASKSENIPEKELRADDLRLKLNVVGWEVFQEAKRSGLFVIDVLTGEPKIWNDPWASKRQGTIRAVEITNTRNAPSIAAFRIAEKTENEKATITRAVPLGEWDGRGSLPERIRLHSKKIVDMLDAVVDSGNRPSESVSSMASIVLLRPFPILTAYNKEIRAFARSLSDEVSRSQEELAPEEKSAPRTTELVSSASIQASQDTKSPAETEELSTAQEKTKEPRKPVSSAEKLVQRDHLTCLVDFMDRYISRKVDFLNSARCNKIFFSDAWYLFQPGTEVISADGKQAFQVVSVRSKRHRNVDRWASFRDPEGKEKQTPRNRSGADKSKEESDDRFDLTVKCVFIHFDGHRLGPVLKTFGINKWDGEKDVTHLDIFPLRFHVQKGLTDVTPMLAAELPSKDAKGQIEAGVQSLRERLVARGKVFVSVAAVKQMYYTGLAVNTRDEIESQVMIDFEEAFTSGREKWAPIIRRLVGTDWDSVTDEPEDACKAECCLGESVHNDFPDETTINREFINSIMEQIKDEPQRLPSVLVFPRSLQDITTEGNALTDEELMIMSFSVFGFVLRDRTWTELDLDYLSDVPSSGIDRGQSDDDDDEASQGAFGQLVLPPGHKTMVLSLISQHFRNKQSPESNDENLDLVRGKGKGLIILLHGAPGVGKTTTAEGVAETFGKPLFQITCGDLGSNPRDVELALQTNFALASRWGCILLLDEADVFLAERRREDFNRNGLVAVFLRVLEYYAGILFLTTNRIGDFDEAFASRIHMSLHYPMLDETSTTKVFRLNLDMIKGRLKDRIRIEEDEIILAAAKHWREHPDARWNGRQIRNACQTALALAENDAQPKGQKYSIKGKSTEKVYLKLAHLKIVSDSYLEFTDYLKAVHGADAAGRAQESGLRALDTLIEALKIDKEKKQDADGGGQSSDRHTRRAAGDESTLSNFKLRRESSSHNQTGPPKPSTPEPVQQSGGYPAWYAGSPQTWSYGSPVPAGQRLHYNQESFGSTQHFGDPRAAGPPSRQGPGGAFYQTHHGYGTPTEHGQPLSASTQYSQSTHPQSMSSQVVSPGTPAIGNSFVQGPGHGYYDGGDRSGEGGRPVTGPPAGPEV